MEDDEKLESIKESYSKGKIMTSEVKEILIQILTDLVVEHQERRKKLTDEDVKKFMSTQNWWERKKDDVKE
jgi:tryptophanyl-tRNA synthetase